MWTIEDVKARFLEAADVERRMIVKGLPGSGNAWPSYRFDEEDMKGWDDQAKLDHLEMWQGRKVTKSPEISRWEEVFFIWTAMIPENRRLLVWRWAQCIASGGSFSKWCEDRGLVRMTAYNRLDRVWTTLAARFSKEARLLRSPDAKWDLQVPQSEIQENLSLKNSVSAKSPRIHPAYISEKSTDHLTNPAALAEFSQHLADVNESRRKAQLRRAKAMRGVPDGQEAA
jgi:hypothetical protein